MVIPVGRSGNHHNSPRSSGTFHNKGSKAAAAATSVPAGSSRPELNRAEILSIALRSSVYVTPPPATSSVSENGTTKKDHIATFPYMQVRHISLLI